VNATRLCKSYRNKKGETLSGGSSTKKKGKELIAHLESLDEGEVKEDKVRKGDTVHVCPSTHRIEVALWADASPRRGSLIRPLALIEPELYNGSEATKSMHVQQTTLAPHHVNDATSSECMYETQT
jgi:hypothetical protein